MNYRWYGYHPNFPRDYSRVIKKALKSGDPELMFGEQISETVFTDQRHPHVICLPSERHCCVVDEFGYDCDRWKVFVPFSSNHFLVDEDDENGVFYVILRHPMFLRQGGINQLQWLIPAMIQFFKSKGSTYVPDPITKHNRLMHAAIMMAQGYVILSRQGFSKKACDEVAFVLAMHDGGTPPGGDVTMRLHRELFDEEMNFARILKVFSESSRDCKMFDIDFDEAQLAVLGKGIYGPLVDVLDKISYTILDAFHLGRYAPKSVLRHIEKNPLVGDVWEDILMTKQGIVFCNSQRLYAFLVLRALLHVEHYLNPTCRMLEHVFSNLVRTIWEAGILNQETALLDDNWLIGQIEERHGLIMDHMVTGKYKWKYFRSQEECKFFSAKMGSRMLHYEYIKLFKTGLDWQVLDGSNVMSLRDALSQGEVEYLERLSLKREGWYAYYRNEK